MFQGCFGFVINFGRNHLYEIENSRSLSHFYTGFTKAKSALYVPGMEASGRCIPMKHIFDQSLLRAPPSSLNLIEA
ncbi:hypothetical protein K1719_029854 [Acacia pycnantha]|nr:hypothetical protein K1719_029854 [Acacia pycnantha]